MTDPVEFEKLRSKFLAAQGDAYAAVFSTQNLELPQDVNDYTERVLAAHVKVRAAERALLRSLKA